MKMPGKLFWVIFFVALFLSLSSDSFAEMQSENYRIPSAVLSGGGAPMSATSYQTNATLGQPSPLSNPADPPFSDSYDLYPGFWYTLVSGPLLCGELSNFAQAFGTTSADSNYNTACDSEPDGDIDGLDLADFLQGY